MFCSIMFELYRSQFKANKNDIDKKLFDFAVLRYMDKLPQKQQEKNIKGVAEKVRTNKMTITEASESILFRKTHWKIK